MKREEAIKILQPIGEQYCQIANITLAPRMDEIVEAIDMAIEALKQPEIVQCKDCDLNDGTCYCNFHYRDVKPNDYCSWRITTNG